MEFADGITLIKECTETSIVGYIMMIIALLTTIALSFASDKIGCILSEATCNNIYERAGSALALVIVLSGIFITLQIIPDLDKFQESNGKYEVVISSDIDMTEFQSRYDIIDYNDGKYTIKIKEN